MEQRRWGREGGGLCFPFPIFLSIALAVSDSLSFIVSLSTTQPFFFLSFSPIEMFIYLIHPGFLYLSLPVSPIVYIPPFYFRFSIPLQRIPFPFCAPSLATLRLMENRKSAMQRGSYEGGVCRVFLFLLPLGASFLFLSMGPGFIFLKKKRGKK